jgi:hypothetical protein
MSACKRNGDLGRKFKCRASKRKRKGDVEKRNEELSGTFLKFLKINKNRSFFDKDYSENKNGEQAEIKYESFNDVGECKLIIGTENAFLK